MTDLSTVDDMLALERMIAKMSPDEQAQLASQPGMHELLQENWLPNPGQQTIAFESEADELFYGGKAGGGKSDLMMGVTFHHWRSLLLRRTNKEARRFIRRYEEMTGNKDGWSGQEQVFKFPSGRLVEMGGVQHEDDKQKFKGEPKDYIGFDEITDFTETQFRFIKGWNRAANIKQRCRVICTGNPPTKPEGLWVIQYWAPWLDPLHPNPAEPGELRWFTTIAGKDTEVDGRGPHIINGEEIVARSRTFIPARLDDNPDLAETDYGSVLAALPAGLREAYYEGRFDASLKDDIWQVIPTAWVDAAMARWTPNGHEGMAMTAMAVDCAGGGNDAAVICSRYGGWYDELDSIKGSVTADGSAMAAVVVRKRKDSCPVIVDVGGGYAGAIIERFKDNGINYHRFDGQGAALGTTIGSGLKFYNRRARMHWRMREALDPDQEGGSAVALPNDPILKADLCSARYEVGPRGIQIERKEKIIERIGRSPDRGDSVMMCMEEGNLAAARRVGGRGGRGPKVVRGYAKHKARGR